MQWSTCRTLFLAPLVCLPWAAGAQTVANSLDELRPLLKVGQTLTIRDENGETTRGTIAEISQDALMLDVETQSGSLPPRRQQKAFANQPLRAFAEQDGLGNGIALGALAGLGAAALSTAGGRSPLVGFLAAAGTVPAGIAVGVILDRIHRHEQIRVEYLKRTAASSVTGVPLFGRQVRGLSMAIRW